MKTCSYGDSSLSFPSLSLRVASPHSLYFFPFLSLFSVFLHPCTFDLIFDSVPFFSKEFVWEGVCPSIQIRQHKRRKSHAHSHCHRHSNKTLATAHPHPYHPLPSPRSVCSGPFLSFTRCLFPPVFYQTCITIDFDCHKYILPYPRQCQRAYLLLLCCSTAARLSFQLSFGSGNMIRTLRLAFLVSVCDFQPSFFCSSYSTKQK